METPDKKNTDKKVTSPCEPNNNNNINNVIDFIIDKTNDYFEEYIGLPTVPDDPLALAIDIEGYDTAYTYKNKNKNTVCCWGTIVSRKWLKEKIPTPGDSMMEDEAVKKSAEELVNFINIDLVEYQEKFQKKYMLKMKNLKVAMKNAVEKRNGKNPRLYESIEKLVKMAKSESESKMSLSDLIDASRERQKLEKDVAESLGLDYEKMEREYKEKKRKDKKKKHKKNII